MRMDRRQSLDAREIVNSYAAEDLARIFRDYGEEPQARRLARAIVERAAKRTAPNDRRTGSFDRGDSRGAAGASTIRRLRCFKLCASPSIKSLDHVRRFLESGYETLLPKGRMAIISFHSLEDRLVKTSLS